VEGSLVGGLVAEVESQAFFVNGTVVMKAVGLQKLRAIAQPMVLGHPLDQDQFGAAHGTMLAFEIDDELVVFLGVLPWQKDEHAASIGEAVARVIAGRNGLALFRPGTGRELCIRLIGGYLRWCRHMCEFRARSSEGAIQKRDNHLKRKEIIILRDLSIISLLFHLFHCILQP
jgi:hypothetical protein